MPTATKPKKTQVEFNLDELMASIDREGCLEDEIREHEAAIEELRASLKGEKEIKAGKLSTLRRLVWERKHPEAHPLFNGKASSNAKPKVPITPIDPQDDSWKADKLADCLPELKPALLQRLHDANLHTMGDLTNWTAEDGGRHRITDIDGVGPAAAEKIEEATAAYWQRRAAAKPEQRASEEAERIVAEHKSHFATCPRAAKFAKRIKARREAKCQD